MKTAIVYSSTTGNTEQLANAIKEAAPDAYFSTADVADPSEVLSAELILLGIPKERIRHYGFAFEGKKVLIIE